jgi:hypothetical protein
MGRSKRDCWKGAPQSINNADWCCSLATGIPNLVPTTNIHLCTPHQTAVSNSVSYFQQEQEGGGFFSETNTKSLALFSKLMNVLIHNSFIWQPEFISNGD